MISVLIPAYNEAERIAATIQSARQISGVSEIIVVDDGSTDDTAKQAEKAGAEVVFRQANQGKRAALNAAFALASGDILLLLDADLGDTAREATKLLEPVRHGGAEMTIAVFPAGAGKGGGMGLVVRLARNGIQRLTGREMQAPLSGQRAIRRHVLESVGGFAEGWGAEVALTVQALRNGFRVLEIPVAMSHRVTGRTPGAILHRAAQYLAVRRVLHRLARPEQLVAPRTEQP